jgi:hypothetical protein
MSISPSISVVAGHGLKNHAIESAHAVIATGKPEGLP